MAKEATLQVVSNLGGKESPVPQATPEVVDRSKQRMGMLLEHARRYAGPAVPNSGEKEAARSARAGGEDSSSKGTPAPDNQSKNGKAEPKPSTPSTESGATKKDEEKPPEKASEKSATPKTEEPVKKDSVTDWEQESKKHQSRADKLDAEVKGHSTKVEELNKQVEELKRYKEQVDQFTADPVTYLTKNAPQLVQKINSSGDPLKMVESELIEFQKQLDATFVQSFGEDWRFSETEGLRPGTPSFRYKLALDDKLSEIRSRYRNFMDEQKRTQEQAQQRIATDKERLSKEYGFTEEHFKKAEEIFSTKNVSYYDLVRALMFDDILQQRLDAIKPPLPPERDIADVPKGGNELKKPKVKVSDEGQKVLARFGRKALSA